MTMNGSSDNIGMNAIVQSFATMNGCIPQMVQLDLQNYFNFFRMRDGSKKVTCRIGKFRADGASRDILG